MEILLFGITRDIIGETKLMLSEAEQISTVKQLKDWLVATYAGMGRLSSMAVAVNSEYAGDDAPLQPGDEIALIPPVSGG
ncbi:molybdopterin converting factor subunit 1 [Pontibacter chitinilyticus]|uniref:molybdopterin converting factor subunit 1 n=1 Tax=Pontibacter chitinilyticus TaxID=2674989 RepID=UPI00321A8AFC